MIKDKFVLINKSNIDFLRKISPRTAPQFYELFYTNANRYGTCLQVIDFPETIGQSFLDTLINMQNVMVMIDKETISNDDVITFLGDNVDDKEQTSSILSKFREMYKNRKEIERSVTSTRDFSESKNTGKCITIRLYLFEKTEEKLQVLVDEILLACKKLKSGAYIQTNDLASDFQALTKLDNPIKEIVPSNVIAEFQMLQGVSLIKPGVSVFGITTDGAYAEDIFSYDYASFCGVVWGLQGSGKSSLFKTIAEDAFLRGDIVFCFDIHFGEYKELFDRYSISSVSFTDEKYINGFEIFALSDIENGVIKQFDVICTQNLMKESIRNLYDGEIQETVMKQLSKLLTELYKKYKGKKIEDFKHDDWFILDDVKALLESKKAKGEYKKVAEKDIYELELLLDELIEEYSFLFNHHTNIDIDLTKSLRFDISFLSTLDDNRVASAYIMLLMSYVQRAMNLNEKFNNAMEKGKDKSTLNRPSKCVLCLFDEWSKYAENKPYLIKSENMVKQSRKARFGFLFAIHTIKDIDVDSPDTKKYIQSIFDLSVVKFIGECDPQSIEGLDKWVKNIDKIDKEIISTFKKGENQERYFLGINDKRQKIVFQSLVTKRQQQYFGGGV